MLKSKPIPNVFEYLISDIQSLSTNTNEINLSDNIEKYVSQCNCDRLAINIYSNLSKKKHNANYEIVLLSEGRQLHSSLLPCAGSEILEWVDSKKVHPILQDFLNSENCKNLYHDEHIIVEITVSVFSVNLRNHSITETTTKSFCLVERTDDERLREYYNELYSTENQNNHTAYHIQLINPYYLRFLFHNRIAVDEYCVQPEKIGVGYLLATIQNFLQNSCNFGGNYSCKFEEKHMLNVLHNKMESLPLTIKPSCIVKQKLLNKLVTDSTQDDPFYYHIFHESDRQLKNNYYVKVVKNTFTNDCLMSVYYVNNFYSIFHQLVKPDVCIEGSIGYIGNLLQSLSRIARDTGYSMLNANFCQAHMMNLATLKAKTANPLHRSLHKGKTPNSRLLSELLGINLIANMNKNLNVTITPYARPLNGSFTATPKLVTSQSLPSLQLISDSKPQSIDFSAGDLTSIDDLNRKRKNRD